MSKLRRVLKAKRSARMSYVIDIKIKNGEYDVSSYVLPYPLPEPWRTKLFLLGEEVVACQAIYGQRSKEVIDARFHRGDLIRTIRREIGVPPSCQARCAKKQSKEK
jgi:hypothetical protein